jgi:hypothetical protein
MCHEAPDDVGVLSLAQRILLIEQVGLADEKY